MKRILTVFMCMALLIVSVISVFADEIPDNHSEDIDSITTGVEAGTPFTISAKSVVLMERSTGQIILSKNPQERLPMASVTKVMTLLLIMEALEEGVLSLDSQVTVSEYAAGMGGSQAYLEVGEQMSVDDMLKCIAVSSCNDAAVAMGEKICGNIESFVEKMNERALELGMKNTHFVNCTGLDAEGHYSSAEDIAIMSRALMEHERIFDYTRIWMDTVRDGQFGLSNTNKLLKVYSGITGLKTGSTDDALYCISATAKRDDTELIAVVLGAPTSKERFTNAAKLLDYGFANYKVITYKLPTLDPVAVEKGKQDFVSICAKEPYAQALVKKNSKSEITYSLSLPEAVYAPINEGDVIGKVTFMLGADVLCETDVLAGETVEKKGFFDCLFEVLKCYFLIKE